MKSLPLLSLHRRKREHHASSSFLLRLAHLMGHHQSGLFFLVCVFAVVGSLAHAAVKEHTFNVGKFEVRQLCKSNVITAVNDKLPGPTLRVQDGDTLIVHVFNRSPYNITIHWHGIFQQLSAWADGPSYVTQCPIPPGGSYTYKFTINGQEGTLWWHAHVSVLRATVYGAIVILPRVGVKGYPFPKPHNEVPILIGEYWKGNVMELQNEAAANGVSIPVSDALTINGRPGDLYGKCSKKNTFKLEVEHGKTYMLRVISAVVNIQLLFFKVAGHKFTVVAADASYVEPYTTDILVFGPGQTLDVLMVADADPNRRYYMASQAYAYHVFINFFQYTTTTGIILYKNSSAQQKPSAAAAPPLMPEMPAFNDSSIASRFLTSLTALVTPKRPSRMPVHVDERMFVAFGLGLEPCIKKACVNPPYSASMNNVSFQLPTEMSLLEAHYRGVKGVYTPDFPDAPPMVFNYTDDNMNTNRTMQATFFPPKGTRLKRLRYNTTVEVVLQNLAIVSTESHAMHLHGFDFYILAHGMGNYDAATAVPTYNLVNPQKRNTVAIAGGGWVVIRFTANNPGVWMMHCHLDKHMSVGMGTAFEVLNGPTPSTILPPPPLDFPKC